MQIPATQINSAPVAMAQLYDNTAGVAIASWDVSNISQSYNHLMMVVNARSDTGATDTVVAVRLNNDSSASYDYQNGLVFASSFNASETFGATYLRCGSCPAATANASRFSNNNIIIPNYTGTNGFKIVTTDCSFYYGTGTGTMIRSIHGGFWPGAIAITRVTVFPSAGNFVAGSRLTIYGLL